MKTTRTASMIIAAGLSAYIGAGCGESRDSKVQRKDVAEVMAAVKDSAYLANQERVSKGFTERMKMVAEDLAQLDSTMIQDLEGVVQEDKTVYFEYGYYNATVPSMNTAAVPIVIVRNPENTLLHMINPALKVFPRGSAIHTKYHPLSNGFISAGTYVDLFIAQDDDARKQYRARNEAQRIYADGILIDGGAR